MSLKWLGKLERAKGFEPSTPTLARLCSTPELHPLTRRIAPNGCPEADVLPSFSLDFSAINGAGEGIRTLDPNLGKVVLYP